MSEHVKRSLIEDYGVKPESCIMVGAESNVVPEEYEVKHSLRSTKEILFVCKQWEHKGGAVLLEVF